MKTLIIALTLATITAAAAQSPIPRTATFFGPDGQSIGTATTTGNTTYFRDANGELIGSSTLDANGLQTFYDPSGKITSTATKSGNVMTRRDADGKVIGTTTLEDDGTATVRDAEGKVTGTGKTRP
jgi:YD repeat-containing protein